MIDPISRYSGSAIFSGDTLFGDCFSAILFSADTSVRRQRHTFWLFRRHSSFSGYLQKNEESVPVSDELSDLPRREGCTTISVWPSPSKLVTILREINTRI